VRAVLTSLILIVPMTAAYGQITVPSLIVAVGVMEGAVQAIAAPGAQLAVARAAPEGRAAAAQGLAGATQLAGATVAALLAAPIYGAWGPGVVFGLVAGVVAVVGLVALALQRRVVATERLAVSTAG
jgi:hypothetical protein